MTSPVLYEGQLMKKGKLNPAWKNRWCTLTEINCEIVLKYFDSKMSGNQQGTVIISQVYAIEVIECSSYDTSIVSQIPDSCVLNEKAKCQTKYSFILATTCRKYHFAAFDPANFINWLSILAHYVNGDVIKQGWLQKRGEKNKGWKRRYFVLNEHKQMKYFQDAQRTQFQGIIALNEVSSIKEGATETTQSMYHLELHTNKRIWILSADSLKQRKSWFDELQRQRMSKAADLKKQTLLNQEIKENDPADADNEEVQPTYQGAVVYDDNDRKSDESEEDFEIEQFVCSQCGKEYASEWPKCPGCARKGTHVKKNSTQSSFFTNESLFGQNDIASDI
mmetsp:Transcript_9186/g.14110  ORF Transcript_9186/g.14110 Transcript_9186/m.14110 type:complete len:335 (-) Transcript_9186:13-1017(-)